MAQTIQKLNIKRGAWTFLVAYALVSLFFFGLFLIILQVIGQSLWLEVEVADNPAYNLAERFMPLVNIVVWIFCAWLYFRGRTSGTYNEAAKLGLLWLIPAAIIDYVGFVLIQHPLSADAYGFYVAQFPWLYLTYIAVFIAPLCYVAFIRSRARRT